MATPHRLHLIQCNEDAPRDTQIPCSNAFAVIVGGRHRRPRSNAEVMRADLPQLWRTFVCELFGCGPGARDETAKEFGVTFQTACNWHDGLVGPMGHAVAHAAKRYPVEFGRIVCGSELRKVA